jgi:GntR family transcriptional repressor for pyruvate dehydrogenase complex
VQPDGESPSERLIYVRIADTLREQILSGQLPPGSRLPSEAELGNLFGASRTSIREALRVLVSQRLIDTSRGATGGSTVRRLVHREVMDLLKDNMRALMIGSGTSHDEMGELRELLEVSATWVAASRRSDEQLERIASCLWPVDRKLPSVEQIDTNLRFHYEILAATGNRLLHLFAEPVLVSINLISVEVPHDLTYYRRVAVEHAAIYEAIRDRDQPAARDAMSAHVAYLRTPGSSGEAELPFAGLCFGPASITPP